MITAQEATKMLDEGGHSVETVKTVFNKAAETGNLMVVQHLITKYATTERPIDAATLNMGIVWQL